MPATITQPEATVAIRAATDADNIEPAVAAALGQLFPAAVELCQMYAPNAPDAMLNAAVVRVLGWLWEAEPAALPGRRASPLHGSGASALLAQWRVHRAGAVGAAGAMPTPTPTPTPGNVPTPPSAGDYVLTSIDGELRWIVFPQP